MSAVLAHNIAHLPPGQYRRACPQCQRQKRDTALSVTVQPDGKRLLFCHRCEFKAAEFPPRADRAPRKPSGAPAAPTVHEVLADWALEQWNGCQQIAGDARAYLEARCCVVPPADGHLRWHPKLRHPAGYNGPALVALVTHAVTTAPLTLHRTWIKPDGTKADVDPPRLLLSGHRKVGGVIRLWPDGAVTSGLAIAEGIESALAVAHVFTPVWSAVDAGNLAGFPVLDGIESLAVFADHDAAGREAARRCAARWRSAGRETRTRIPDKPGADPNDWWRERVARSRT